MAKRRLRVLYDQTQILQHIGTAISVAVDGEERNRTTGDTQMSS